MSEITKKVTKLHKQIQDFRDHRYHSWNHCHNFFRKIRNRIYSDLSQKEKELAKLHLGFYLASWGMYRGSSFLLQKDYEIYGKIIPILLDKKYLTLWDLKKNIRRHDLIEIFCGLYDRIQNVLSDAKRSITEHPDLGNNKFSYDNVSEILITKILLGTIGCIPAYDNYFKKGLKKKGYVQSFKPEPAFDRMLDFYKNNWDEINSLTKYGTPMKIIDMYFFLVGLEKDKALCL